MDNRDVIQLLAEIRDIQKEHLEEYRRVTQESLELGRKSVSQQLKAGQVQRWTIAGASVALVFFIMWLVLVLIAQNK